jgi:hypothetical protein
MPVAAAGAPPLAAAGAAVSAFFLLLPEEAPLSELVDSGAEVGAVDSLLPLLVLLLEDAPLLELLAAGAALLVSAAGAYHFLTPPWPLHAPLLDAAEV